METNSSLSEWTIIAACCWAYRVERAEALFPEYRGGRKCDRRTQECRYAAALLIYQTLAHSQRKTARFFGMRTDVLRRAMDLFWRGGEPGYPELFARAERQVKHLRKISRMDCTLTETKQAKQWDSN